MNGQGVITLAVSVIKLLDTQWCSEPDHAAPRDETRQAPGGVGTAAETKDENLVLIFVVLDQPLVGRNDNVVDPVAKGTAADLFVASGAYTYAVENILFNIIWC